MLKRAFGCLLAALLLVFVSSAAFAVVKGLESGQGSIVKIGENITVPQGADVKSVVAVGGSVTVLGEVKEDVVAVGGSVYLKDTALVAGDAVSIGGKVVREPGAVARGEVIEVSSVDVGPLVVYFTKGGIVKGVGIFYLLTLLGFIIMAVILVAMFTPQLGRISGLLEGNLLRNFLVGLVIALLFLPVIFVLVVSIVGIVLIPVWMIAVAAACLFGYIAACHVLGKKTLHACRLTNQSMMTETVAGIVLLSIVGLVPVGGFLVKMIAALCGLGGVYETRFGTR
ncbi:MAG: hypothetical protein JW873_05290 [Candidatus Saganbacteria bacterium]|nr:hypothetical protein [Candidatus Saganbacteria bacterium]